MSGKTITDCLNTLDYAKNAVGKVLGTEKSEVRNFRTPEQLEQYLSREFKQLVGSGNFSYDPTYGELIVSYSDELDIYQKFDDERTAAKVIEDFFVEQGWVWAAIIPPRTGVNKTLVRIRSDELKSPELMS